MKRFLTLYILSLLALSPVAQAVKTGCRLGDIAPGLFKSFIDKNGNFHIEIPRTDPKRSAAIKNKVLDPVTKRLLSGMEKRKLIVKNTEGKYYSLLSEIIANSIEYGERRPCQINLSAGKKRGFRIEIIDQSGHFFDPMDPGEARNRRRMDFDPKDPYGENLPANLRRRREGGLGVDMIFELAEDLGLTVTYEKRETNGVEGTAVVITNHHG